MILGVTGTRHAPTDKQLSWLWEQIRHVDELHHGACVGADAAAHQAAKDSGVRIVAHPPTDERLMMPVDHLIWNWKPAKPYHDRNRDIVDACDRLIALPDGPERAHSGTWYTVGYATGQNQVLTANRRVVPVTICYPDGTTEDR